jgi:hypothetical protein
MASPLRKRISDGMYAAPTADTAVHPTGGTNAGYKPALQECRLESRRSQGMVDTAVRPTGVNVGGTAAAGTGSMAGRDARPTGARGLKPALPTSLYYCRVTGTLPRFSR